MFLATRNFDLAITLKDSASATVGETREFVFMSIDRSEYPYLSDYIRSKEIPVKNAQVIPADDVLDVPL